VKRRELLLGAAAAPLPRLPGTKPRNVLFILSDDHRWDAMGAMGHPFLKTPAMDRLSREGAHFRNAFVTTSLCSPSRATILTGLYAHNHHVTDNVTPAPKDLVYFPQYLQAAGYETAFIGKWHMGGETDAPRPGFHHWVSFRGQGQYNPGQGSTLNINGKSTPQRGYITDELTDYALDWLKGRSAKPWFLMLSHKAVHGGFQPAARHKGAYAKVQIPEPATGADTPENYAGKPRWVKTQRNSTHGADYPDQKTVPLMERYRAYCETLLALDESIGRVTDFLAKKGELDSTLVIYMGDNGYQWGEHGLQDKRTAYEASMRVPMLARCPEMFGPRKVTEMALNLDIAPTVLEAAGLRAAPKMQGRSLLPAARGPVKEWREHVLYEYFWERNYPMTPSLHAIRTDRWKYIHYHGVWDCDELYDIASDPLERTNLIAKPEHAELVAKLNAQLFDELESTGGMYIPLSRDRGRPQMFRRVKGSRPGDFPPWMYRDE
jgi:N-acetylglucosamine-6-sulfatase